MLWLLIMGAKPRAAGIDQGGTQNHAVFLHCEVLLPVGEPVYLVIFIRELLETATRTCLAVA
jgi:hypothetical protein